MLESGGRAATALMDRLQQTHQRITSLDVSTDTLLVCREEEVLSPLLAWSSVDTTLQPFVETLATRSVPAPDEEFVAHHQTEFAATPDSPRRTPSTTVWQRDQIVKPTTAATISERLLIRSPLTLRHAQDERGQVPYRGDVPLRAERVEARFRREQPPQGNVSPASQEQVGLPPIVTHEDAARHLRSTFSGDERLLRAWDQPIVATSAPHEVVTMLTDPEPLRSMITETPQLDPMSVRLQPTVDRALRTSLTRPTGDANRSGLRQGTITPGDSEATSPRWDSPGNREETSRALAEARPLSALRRLASYGETIEPERALVRPVPSAAVPREAPPRQPLGALERADIAQEVADIFRREALRHGIVPEEDTP